MGRLSVILLDTNVLLFVMLNQDRMTESATKAISDADGLLVSSISIWDIAIKNKKGKLPLPFTPEELVFHLKNVTNLEILPVDEMVWLKNISLDWDHRDSADRTIVATAALRGIPIITSDRIIRGYYPKCIW